MTYPCTFVEAAEKPLEELVPRVKPGSWRKVRTLTEAIHGKVKLVQGLRPNMPNTFVLKQMPLSAMGVAGQRSQMVECPRNEIHAALAISRLGVAHTAEVLFAAQDDKSMYLASEHCPHGELLAVVNSAGRLKGDGLLREVMQQLLTAVASLHENGVAHRDLSLENVLVAADGGLRIIDWAQAIMVHAPGDSQHEARVSPDCGPPGKPNYRGPELYQGTPYLATKADMFAVGVMLYALAVGTYPIAPEVERGPTGKLSYVPCSKLFPPSEVASGRCSGLALQLSKACGGHVDRVSAGCLDLMEQLMAPNPELRLSADEALAHPWLTGALSGLEDAMTDVGTSCEGGSDCSDVASIGE